MKKLLFTLLATIFCSYGAFAQRIAYVDTDYILNKIPAYEEAQKSINNVVEVWNKEIDAKYAEVKQMYSKYQAEEFLLTDELKKKRQDEIIAKEQIANDLQKQRFGYEGDLFKKRQELIQPIQEKVYNAVEKLAKTGGYDFILDKTSSGATLLFTNSKYDLSEQVLKSIQP
ncbi:MAG: OmpH family outer membrane protein [Chitinophagales bacterium]|nr:OmpH family outer membrane protein [Chitinophagales bacterium]